MKRIFKVVMDIIVRTGRREGRDEVEDEGCEQDYHRRVGKRTCEQIIYIGVGQGIT